MKALVIYFSGTGNTYFIAKEIKERMNNIMEIDMVSIEKISGNNLPQHDILFLGFPVYETDSPLFLHEYIKQLPQVSDKGLFLFCTHGGFPGNALRKNFKRMVAKGYIPLGFLKIGMMDTGAITFMKKNSPIVKYIKNRDYTKLKALEMFINKAKNILLNMKDINDLKKIEIILPYNLFGSLFDWLFKLMYKIWVNCLKKRFWVDEKCNLCELCIKICPVKNISLNNSKIVFDTKCFLCFRCLNQCPNEAIQIGKKTINKFRWRGPNNCFNPLKI